MHPNRKELASEVKLVVEVDGNPVGFLNLDIDRLWPLINHRKAEDLPVEWIDASKLETVMRAAVVKRLMARLETHLYQALGKEIVQAELDAEAFKLKADGVAQEFGREIKDIEKLVAKTDRTPNDFYSFFWEHLLRDNLDITELKKEWKAAGTPRR